VVITNEDILEWSAKIEKRGRKGENEEEGEDGGKGRGGRFV
jgi:hypothetical protein